MERFVIIVNIFQPLTIITKRSVLDDAAVLDPPLPMTLKFLDFQFVSINGFVSGLFVIAVLLEAGKKNIFLILWF